MSARQSAFLAVLLFFGSAAPTWAGDVPGEKSTDAPKLDAFGDPLPPGAYARFGTIRFRHDAKAVAFLDKNTIVSVGSNIRFWDAATGRLIREHRHEKMAWTDCATISANGKRAITMNESTVLRVWDIASGRLIRECKLGPPIELSGLENYEPSISVSADGNCFISGIWEIDQKSHDATQAVRIWRVESMTEPILLQTGIGDVRAYAISPDGKRAVTVLRRDSGKKNLTPGLAIWDAVSGKQLCIVKPNVGIVERIQFVKDGAALAIEGTGGIEIRAVDGNEIWRQSSEVDELSLFATTSDHLIAWANMVRAEEFELRVMDATTGKTKHHWKAPPWMRREAPSCSDGERIVVADSQCLHVLKLADGAETEPARGHIGAIGATCMTPDGRFVVSASGDDGELIAWNIATGREFMRLKGHTHGFLNIAISTDGKLLASTSEDTSIRVLDRETGRQLTRLGLTNLKLMNDRVSHLEFLADNSKLAVGSQWNGIAVYHLPSGKKIHEFSIGKSIDCRALIRHPDGRMLAIVGGGDPDEDDGSTSNGINVWDIVSKRIIRHLDVHRSRWFHSVLSRDGRTLATRDGDGLIRLWELATGSQRLAIRETEAGHILEGAYVFAFSPDGLTIASSNPCESQVRLWNVPSGAQIASFHVNEGQVNTLEFAPNSRHLLTGFENTTILGWDMTRPEWKSRPLSSNLSDKDLAMGWDRLRNGTAEQANRSKWALAGDPAKTVAFLRKQIQPEQPLSVDRVRGWIADLDVAQFYVRERASRELSNHFDQVETELREALKGANSAETRKRLSQIIASAENGVPEPDQLRDLRALEVLEQIGTPEARDLLRRLAKSDVSTAISRDAAQSLKRLEARQQ